MGNKTKEPHKFHEIIRTKHVFIKEDRVFMKRDTQESVLPDNH